MAQPITLLGDSEDQVNVIEKSVSSNFFGNSSFALVSVIGNFFGNSSFALVSVIGNFSANRKRTVLFI